MNVTFRWAMTLLLGAAAPTTVAAQGSRQVEAGYEVTFAGFEGFRIDIKLQFDGTAYDVESHAFKKGTLRALTPHYEGYNRAWGVLAPGGARPTGGSLSVAGGDKRRTWLVRYGAGGTLQETHSPMWQPAPHHAISDDRKRGSLDPLSAALSVGTAGDAACEQTVASNDGRRRVDVVLRKVGTESPVKAGVPQAKGDLLVCEVRTVRVAGEFADAPEDAERRPERPIRLWLARFDETPFRYPARIEASTSLGTVRGRMVHFRERPLTQ